MWLKGGQTHSDLLSIISFTILGHMGPGLKPRGCILEKRITRALGKLGHYPAFRSSRSQAWPEHVPPSVPALVQVQLLRVNSICDPVQERLGLHCWARASGMPCCSGASEAKGVPDSRSWICRLIFLSQASYFTFLSNEFSKRQAALWVLGFKLSEL